MALDAEDDKADRGAMQAVIGAIDEELLERRMERQDLADKVGLHPSTVTRLLQGRRRLQLHELAAIEDALDLVRGHFLRRVDLVRDAASTREAIQSDPLLDAHSRDDVLASYDFAVERTESRRSTRRSKR